jgi:hypothetical protein
MNNLYQLKTNAPAGALVSFDGVHDNHGMVMKRQDSGYHLIRGLGMNSQGKTIHYSAETNR